MKNINQWAFDAVSGYEGSADVDGWQEMSKDELQEQAEAQVDHYGPADFEGDFDAEKVASALYSARDTDQNDTFHIRAELAD